MPDAVEALKQGLRELRERDGNPPFRELAARTGLSHSVLSQAIASPKLPTWSVTSAFVAACGGDEGEWRQRWLRARATADRDGAHAAASGGPAGGLLVADSQPQFVSDLARRLDKSALPRHRIADRAGVAPSTLSSMVNGHRLPRADMLQLTLAAVSASTDEIEQWLARRARLAATGEAEHLLLKINQLAADTRLAALRGQHAVRRRGVLVSWLCAGTTLIGGLTTLTAAGGSIGQSAVVEDHRRPAAPSSPDRTQPPVAFATITETTPRFDAKRLSAGRHGDILKQGDKVVIVCRDIFGELVGGDGQRHRSSTAWDKLPDGTYVPSTYVSIDPTYPAAEMEQCREITIDSDRRIRPTVHRPTRSPKLGDQPTHCKRVIHGTTLVLSQAWIQQTVARRYVGRHRGRPAPHREPSMVHSYGSGLAADTPGRLPGPPRHLR